MNIERPTSNVEWEKMKKQTYDLKQKWVLNVRCWTFIFQKEVFNQRRIEATLLQKFRIEEHHRTQQKSQVDLGKVALANSLVAALAGSPYARNTSSL